jgi:hypothetical protein
MAEFMTLKEQYKVIQGALAGKKVRFVLLHAVNSDNWSGWVKESAFDFTHYRYEVQPDALEFWVNIYDNGGFCAHDCIERAQDQKGPIVRRAVLMREVR